MKHTLALLTALLTATQGSAAEISAPHGTLVLDQRGMSLTPRDAASPAITAQDVPLWTLVLQTPSTPSATGERRLLTATAQKPRWEKTPDCLRLIYEDLTDGQQIWKIQLVLEFRLCGGGFQISGEVRNGAEGWTVREWKAPILGNIMADPAKHPLLWPNGLGQRFTNATAATERSFTYPSGTGTMPWCAFAGAAGGLYVGCHDPEQAGKTFAIRSLSPGGPFHLSITHQPFCASGQRWQLPPTVLLPYAGSWHAAARCYRSWFDSVRSVAVPPAWARSSSGWILAILKQQNGDVMWDYAALEQLCDIADRRGLDVLGLFGWTHGGHDRFYPDTYPDPLMGGGDALRRGLEQVRRRGKRAILYVSGQDMDTATDYYRYQGNDVLLQSERSEAVTMSIRKFNSSTPVVFAKACNGTEAWFDRMLASAVQAHRLGADGVIYDTLGVTGPMPCFAPNHRHATPATACTSARREMLKRIAEHMRTIAPEFVVMIEGINDNLVDSATYFHGWGVGCTPAPAGFYASGQVTAGASGTTWPWMRDAYSAFPEMFRYTFPETLMTLRHATPMLDRHFVNYACVHGLRHEIETRWRADVRYLKDEIVPAPEDYRDCTYWPPDLAMMRGTLPKEATRYLREVVDFQRRHAGLLWEGRFVDTEGFDFQGERLIAKGFARDNELGVVVWNPTDKPASFVVKAAKGRLAAAAEPGRDRVEPFEPLAPQSLRLLVWRTTTEGEKGKP